MAKEATSNRKLILHVWDDIIQVGCTKSSGSIKYKGGTFMYKMMRNVGVHDSKSYAKRYLIVYFGMQTCNSQWYENENVSIWGSVESIEWYRMLGKISINE